MTYQRLLGTSGEASPPSATLFSCVSSTRSMSAVLFPSMSWEYRSARTDNSSPPQRTEQRQQLGYDDVDHTEEQSGDADGDQHDDGVGHQLLAVGPSDLAQLSPHFPQVTADPLPQGRRGRLAARLGWYGHAVHIPCGVKRTPIIGYRVSRCKVCVRQRLQYFRNSSRSGSLSRCLGVR